MTRLIFPGLREARDFEPIWGDAVNKEYDVIVIGAGFGGPVAAKRCADAGLKTLMLERGKVPGDKVISGLGIPAYALLFGPRFIRDGNPPIERPIGTVINRFVKDGEIFHTDRLWRINNPSISVAYTAYCKPFCIWLCDRAVESGAELRTSVTATAYIIENGVVKGVLTDTGEAIRSKIVIDSGGTQNNLPIKAGIRKKYIPEAVELYMIWDYEMSKEDVDRIFGYSLEFFHAMPEEKIGPPLGYGSTNYVFTYREGIHPGMGQFLLTNGKVPSVAKLLEEYHARFTTTVSRWKDEIAPCAKLRGVLWDICPIYAGLIPEMREMPIHSDGLLIVGDAAGFEASAFADGVPNAWFSADIAAEVAIDAIRSNDISKKYLNTYVDKINSHPFITHCISDKRRWDLRYVKNEKELIKAVNDQWGSGAFRYKNMGKPVLHAAARSIKENWKIPFEWREMLKRYYRNWENNTFDKLSIE